MMSLLWFRDYSLCSVLLCVRMRSQYHIQQEKAGFCDEAMSKSRLWLFHILPFARESCQCTMCLGSGRVGEGVRSVQVQVNEGARVCVCV